MTKRVDAQDAAFQERAQAAVAHIEDVRVKQLSCRRSCRCSLSLAALQGLEAKSKKLLAAFRQDVDEAVARLRAMVASDLATLAASAQELVRVCAAQLFPDLQSMDGHRGLRLPPRGGRGRATRDGGDRSRPAGAYRSEERDDRGTR
ncbi:hypothetical protein PINS_up024405 [Pythium insidiosum]|nr:hypothetical protein PINS_up024405 [Pythium insidiosum]